MYIVHLKAMTKAAIVVAAAATLVSCGDSGGGNGNGGPGGGGTPPPPAQLPIPSQLGIGFSITFGAAATSEPRDPQPGDVIPISLSADPIDIPDPM